MHIALGLADFSEVKALAIDETSRARGHDYITLAADALERRVLFVTEGRDANTIKELAAHLQDHGCPPEQIESVSIDMSPAFIKGVSEELPNARITFDKFHVVWHASTAVDKMRRIEQRTNKSLKGMRWSLLKDRSSLRPEAAADLDELPDDVEHPERVIHIEPECACGLCVQRHVAILAGQANIDDLGSGYASQLRNLRHCDD